MTADQAGYDRTQLQRVEAVTDAALAHLTLDLLLDELLVRVRDLMDVDTAAVLLLDQSGKELVATAAKGIEEEVEQGVHIPVGGGFAGTVAATAKPVILSHVDHGKVLNPILLEKGIKSLLGVPLIVTSDVVGVLHVGTLHHRDFTENDVLLLQLVADRVALAVYARQQEGSRLIAETLQRSLLPERLPRYPDIEIAARYQPAQGGVVGGDWYDVFSLPSGKLCVIIGDVVGRGLAAATAMAKIRNAVRAISLLDKAPGRIVTHVNDVVLHFDPGVMATLLVALIEEDGVVTYASAGHLPPLIVGADGSVQMLDEPSEPAIGARPYTTYRDRNAAVENGSTLLLYTDGLVERRGASLDDGLDRLQKAAGSSEWSSIDTLVTRVLGVGPGSREDDLAVIALRFGRRTAETLQISIGASPRELATLRRALRSWLEEADVPEQDRYDVMLAVCEAASNSIEHGYGPGQGTVDVTGGVDDEGLVLTVTDRGSWRQPRGTERGRGRMLISAMMDQVDYKIEPSGTTVVMRKRLEGVPVG